MTLVDANILVYANGRIHPYKQPCLDFLERLADGEVEATIDAEALQEILHRYRSLRRWSEGMSVYNDVRLLFPDVLAVTAEVTDHARALMNNDATLAARDAVHAGVVKVYGLDSICSYDRDFDRISGIRRIQP
ncbi:MAG: type II toxin-antitoxin system VapC family toxin [Acidobacteriota bacterium]